MNQCDKEIELQQEMSFLEGASGDFRCQVSQIWSIN
jgi:hypothetical protein